MALSRTIYTWPMAAATTPQRVKFETLRRRSAFVASLPAGMTATIATDTWISSAFGIVGGVAGGLTAYALVFGYESLIWRRRNAS